MNTIPEIRTVACIGTGQMGPGIAQTCAAAGYRAIVVGRSEEGLERARARIRANLAAMQPYGLVDEADIARIWSNLEFAVGLQGAADADLVIEGVAEDLAVKQQVFAELESVCRPDAILISTTSGMRATDIAAHATRPGRILVGHYWNPPHLLPLVEVAPGERTDPAATDVVMRFLKTTGHSPVLCRKEALGFVANRLQHALWREALAIVEQGIATPEEVDEAMKTSFGARTPVLGIFEHLDLVGAPTVYSIHSYLLADLDVQKGPNRLLQEKMDSGEIGAKVGKGFYDWSKKSAADVLRARDELLLELAVKRQGRK
jgi:3-hydroxybutyryl-CoA dehydrogenase